MELPAQEEEMTQEMRPRDRFGVRDLFVWSSLSHREQQYPKEFFKTIAAIAFLLSIICAFFQEWLAIPLVWSVVFLYYALQKVPPTETEHKITTHGIVSLGRSYIWAELGPFWFSEKAGVTTLHISHRNLLGQLMMIIDKNDKAEIRDVLADYLPYIEVPVKSTSEKIADWFSRKFPLEKVVMGKVSPPTVEPREEGKEPASASTPI